MTPTTKKIITEILVIMGKAGFTGLAYGLAYNLAAKIWRL